MNWSKRFSYVISSHQAPFHSSTNQNLGSAPNAKRMSNVVKFYKALPQGTTTPARATSPMGKYAQKYFYTNSSRPLLHLIAFMFLLGYSTDYYFHLRHHK